MSTTQTDVRTADAGTLTSRDLTIAARYLERSAAYMQAAEVAAVPGGDIEAVRRGVEMSKRLARHALAIVLGERLADAEL